MVKLAKTPQSVRNSARMARWNTRLRQNDLTAFHFKLSLQAR